MKEKVTMYGGKLIFITVLHMDIHSYESVGKPYFRSHPCAQYAQIVKTVGWIKSRTPQWNTVQWSEGWHWYVVKAG